MEFQHDLLVADMDMRKVMRKMHGERRKMIFLIDERTRKGFDEK